MQRHAHYLYWLAAIHFAYQPCTAYTVTNPKRSDGFGAQFQTIIASVIYAELTGQEYVYTPFKQMEHNYDHDPGYMEKKEWLINFIGNFEIKGLIDFFEANLLKCANSDALRKIKSIFRANKARDNYFNNENLNIVVHMRRPNSHDSRTGGTDTPEATFLTIIEKLRVVYGSEDPLFHIHSQGNIENFKAFNAPDIVLHLNESVEDSFCAMVLADVLVAGASSFSYTAGILAEGTVYYTPFWHEPLPHWISIETL